MARFRVPPLWSTCDPVTNPDLREELFAEPNTRNFERGDDSLPRAGKSLCSTCPHIICIDFVEIFFNKVLLKLGVGKYLTDDLYGLLVGLIILQTASIIFKNNDVIQWNVACVISDVSTILYTWTTDFRMCFFICKNSLDLIVSLALDYSILM
uniref:Uncharacterized protein n=1 Tax=Vespula pensylvanica TaxID=30213 RepID=A0A834NQR9_VESPE|nr:hypothetical protein H0235_012428 [Vespula pensylvanica]